MDNLKEFFGETNEVVQSTQIAVEDRLSSPFYGYFIIAWLVVNWHPLYIAFFIDQGKIFEKTGFLRNEYLFSILPISHTQEFWWKFFLFPLTLTLLFFWVFPYGTRIFYRKSIRNQKALRIIELQENKKEAVQEKELAKAEVSLIKEEIEKAKEEKRAAKETPEVVWEREFKNFQKIPLYQKFDYIVRSVYEHNGDITVRNTDIYSGPITFRIPQDILAFSHTNGLVTLDKKEGKIELTEKGRFFVLQYIQVK